MNRNKWIASAVALALMAGSAGLLWQFKTRHKLGLPGVKTSSIEGSRNLRVELPERVLDYTSKSIETEKIVLDMLPRDTSFGQRIYSRSTNEAPTRMNVVLMGTDRTSLHKPEFCLTGAGWKIDSMETTTVPIERPHPYDLRVRKFMTTREFESGGRVFKLRGIYVFWFVADHELAANHSERMWSMARHLLTSGELQRWAYVTCFGVCEPGHEEAEFARMKQFISAAVPQFQLAAGPPTGAPSPEVGAVSKKTE